MRVDLSQLRVDRSHRGDLALRRDDARDRQRHAALGRGSEQDGKELPASRVEPDQRISGAGASAGHCRAEEKEASVGGERYRVGSGARLQADARDGRIQHAGDDLTQLE